MPNKSLTRSRVVGAVPFVSREIPSWARVVALFQNCCPPAIVRRVRAVVVDAVELVLRCWAWPHVGKECGEIIAPTLTHGNATSAPIWVSAVRRVVAASAHVAPRLVFRRSAASRLVAVDGASTPSGFADQTTATARCASQKMVESNLFGAPTVAPTVPIRVTGCVVSPLQRYKFRESFTCEVA